MARLDDIPQPTRDAMVAAPCPAFETELFAAGPQSAQRRVANRLLRCTDPAWRQVPRRIIGHRTLDWIQTHVEIGDDQEERLGRVGSDMALSYHQSHDVIMRELVE